MDATDLLEVVVLPLSWRHAVVALPLEAIDRADSTLLADQRADLVTDTVEFYFRNELGARANLRVPRRAKHG